MLLALAVECDKRHAVLGECASLVCADLVCSAHCLTRIQSSHQVLLVLHFHHGVSERDSHSKRESFWHGNDNNRNPKDEVVKEAVERVLGEDRLAVYSLRNQHVQHACDECQQRTVRADLSDECGNLLQLSLKRRSALVLHLELLLCLSLQGVLSDAAD